jgi:hypothetical protein
MALVGYELEKQRIEDKIRQIRAQLGGRAGSGAGRNSASAKSAGMGPRRTLSASARKRIAAAQRKRWAEHRKRQAQSGRG